MTELEDHEKSVGLPRHAPAGVAAFSCLFPVVQMGLIAENPLTQGVTDASDVWALVGTALLLPLHAHHIYQAARGANPPGSRWTLLVLTIIVVGTLPLAGPLWLPNVHVIAVSALVVLRPRWSVPLATAAVVALLPVSLAWGDHSVKSWYVIAAVWRGSALFALVWLAGALRRLQAARRALAERAVEQERLRIDAELRETLGNALEGIVVAGRRAPALLDRDPSAAEHELASLTGEARRTLAEARRLISGYHDRSLRSELDTAVSLLTAAGIRTRVVAPESLPDTLDPGAQAQLMSATATMLADQQVRDCVIAVRQTDGKLSVHLRPDDGGPAVKVGTSA